jgi:hypothetical protein
MSRKVIRKKEEKKEKKKEEKIPFVSVQSGEAEEFFHTSTIFFPKKRRKYMAPTMYLTHLKPEIGKKRCLSVGGKVKL